MASRRQSGYSLIELMLVVAMILILAAVTAVSMQPMWTQQHVDDAYNITLNSLRRAHDLAATDMREYVVTFGAPNPGVNGGTITAIDPISGNQLFSEVLPPDVTFNTATAGMPNTNATVPDNFGSNSNGPFDFDWGAPGDVGAGNTIYFYPDGTAKDVNGNVNNGVVYMGFTGRLQTYRAVTLWGYTGRIRGWQLYQIGGTWTWQQR